ncbi:MAG: thrombospondin type 3 repeat-containing protein [Candidatus Spechtbacterales bacterium]|nr:thrombospondin type 3 repeat-containing protein [Candidatus Spechtbacterales bacterium]
MKIKNKYIAIFVAVVTVATMSTAYANSDIISAFKEYKDIPEQSIIVPTVIEVPFDNEFIERRLFAVLNNKTNKYEPSYFRTSSRENEISVDIEADGVSSFAASRMIDDSLQTYTNFELPEDQEMAGRTIITLTGERPIVSSSLSLLLDDHVALPNTIKITAGSDDTIVVATKRLISQRINFPRTTASTWKVTLTYSQPLRISEFRLNQENVGRETTSGLRFLAQPETSYRIYFNTDRYVSIPTGERPDLVTDEGVLRIDSVPSQDNPEYIEPDVDGDGVPDRLDNCVNTANADQVDINNNNRGDACDDFDRDGIINSRDNCPDQPNRGQQDIDGDGIGDICDGEESRITEKYPWLPWLGLGIAAAVLLALFIVVAKSTITGQKEQNKKEDTQKQPDPPKQEDSK